MPRLRWLLGALSHRRTRALAVAAVCSVGVAIYAASNARDYPIRDWLFWRLLVLWGWCALLNGACLLFGHSILTRGLGQRDLPVLETLVISAAVGLVSFTMAMYLLGALALFRPAVAIALPVLMILSGGPGFWRFARERWAAREPRRTTLSELAGGALVAAGVIGAALVYLQCMTPASVSYDARWYHLAIAEDYAREGRIVPFLADYNKSFPHLASVVHTWGWLVPGLTSPLRWMLALHNEFCLWLWTLAGIGAGTAWLIGQARVRGAWAAFFLFPIIFVYDSNIGGGADHFVAFFALPAFLAAVRAGEDLDPRRCGLAAALAAGALLSKYQAVYILVPIAIGIGGRWAWLAYRARRGGGRRGLWKGPVTAIAVGVAVTAPHFLKNWIFYRNPLYPFAIATFVGSRPRQPDSPFLVKYLLTGDTSIPRGPLPEMLGNAVKLAFTFSFRQPVATMGSLFTLLLPAIVFLPRSRRLWLAALASLIALVTWAMTYPVDRYLQAVIPLLAAVTAAIIVRAWELGWVARAALVAVVGFQVAASGDVPFRSGGGRLSDALAMINGGAQAGARTRFAGYLHAQQALDRRLPPKAVLLFHNTRLGLGVNRKVLQDLPGFQGLIDVRGVHTPRELCALYRSFGITHVVHERGAWPAFSKQEEVLFASLLSRYATDVFREGEYEVFALPPALPPVEAPFRVLAVGSTVYADGIYPVEAMDILEPLLDRFPRHVAPARSITPEEAAAPGVIDQIDAVIVGSGKVLPAPLDAAMRDRFTLVISYGGRFSVYARRSPAPR